MQVQQFYDEGLAQASYAILSQGKIALIDPERDPQPYYQFAREHQAEIVAVIETHPHADFVSSHLEIHQTTGATIYIHEKVGAEYPHQVFNDGDKITLGDVTLYAMETPGHSPDSNTVILEDENGKDYAAFTGDTLFIGDVGRPDLREKAGNIKAKREELAKMMYHSTREKLMKLDEKVLVYPAHGAGSLCGKNLSDDTVSTIGRELKYNYALQPMSEADFIDNLLEGQPFIPKYFGYNVDINKAGAPPYQESVKAVPRLDNAAELEAGILIIDTRPEKQFKEGHIKGSINIQEGDKFETWVGTLVDPRKPFYLITEEEESRENLIRKLAKIGYEPFIKGAIISPREMKETSDMLNVADFKTYPEKYTIVDIRNHAEYESTAIFEHSLNIPLPELEERADEIPHDKPVVVHCAGGYRSAVGSSLIERIFDNGTPVYDLSESVKDFI